jgi:hypothetical protein
MASHPPRIAPREDADGVRIFATPGSRLVARLAAAAMVVVVVATFVAWLVLRADVPSAGGPVRREAAKGVAVAATSATVPSAAPAATAPASPAPAPAKPVRVARRKAPAAPATPPAAGVEPPSLDAGPVIKALQAAGETEGIAAFGVPGTDPPKPGIIVPDDFELPEGYVRHHQVTDEGEQLPPILMFHPDYEFLDEHGVPVAVPADRVVPPEMAPPGLPIRMLEIPRAGRTP